MRCKMIEINKLTIDEYYYLLDTLNWKRPSERLLKISLDNGINVKYVLNGKTIGMARFVTDGGYAGLIMDVIVLPEYQGNGYGTEMISALIEYIKNGIKEDEEIMSGLLSFLLINTSDQWAKYGKWILSLKERVGG